MEDPGRFRQPSVLGAHLGLTPRTYASGETERNGHITRCGDRMVRPLLREAGTVLPNRVRRWSRLEGWGVQVAHRRGARRAQVALARRLAVLLHGIRMDGTEFRARREGISRPAAA